MFTGIITAVGTVVASRRDERGLELVIAAPYRDLEPGESVAVDGACLTVEKTGESARSGGRLESGESGRSGGAGARLTSTSAAIRPVTSDLPDLPDLSGRSDSPDFTVHVVPTSLDRTRFGNYTAGRRVNLERALRAGDRMGGHIVQGHVDGVGEVLRVEQRGDTWLMDIAVPAEVAGVTIPLGSITVDGVSLTVNAIPERGQVQVSLIPFTLEHTTLGERHPGSRVHLEGDVLGKYVAALVAPHRQAPNPVTGSKRT